jgi:Ctr copper transporter family
MQKLFLSLSLCCLALSCRTSWTLLLVEATAEVRPQDAMDGNTASPLSPGDRTRDDPLIVQNNHSKGAIQRSQISVTEKQQNLSEQHSPLSGDQQQQQQQAKDDEDQCQGMYMAMFMDGFHWSSTACLNFFVSSWKLTPSDSGACIFSFLLSVLMESLLAARMFLLRKAPDRYGLLMAVYLLQTLLGYLLMLVAMTFSAPLIAALILGLVVGNYLFAPSVVDESSSERGSAVIVPRPLPAPADRGIQQTAVPGNTSSAGSVTLRRRG